jgi:hypothetical protein
LELKVDPEYAPRFGVNDTVWIIAAGKACKDEVNAINFEYAQNQARELVLFCTGYRLSHINGATNNGYYRPFEIYSSEAEAHELATWHAVTMTQKEWVRAIGSRQNEKSIDRCELAPCCANVSAIRDMLLRCQRDGGLMERDRQKLGHLLDEHEYPMPNGKRPENLDKIMGQLNLLDKAKE